MSSSGVADPQVISTLVRKQREIERAILTYEKKLDQARRDLSHVNATLRLFKVNGTASEFPVYMDLHRLFRRGEVVTLCKSFIAEEGPLDTRELALRVVRAKGLDEDDKPLRGVHLLQDRSGASDAGEARGNVELREAQRREGVGVCG